MKCVPVIFITNTAEYWKHTIVKHKKAILEVMLDLYNCQLLNKLMSYDFKYA